MAHKSTPIAASWMLLVATARAAVVEFGDGAFTPSATPCPVFTPGVPAGHSALAGYTLVKDVRGGPDGYTCFEQRTSSGTQGAYAHVTIEPNGGQIIACLFKDDAIHDPGPGSGFAYVDYTEDSICFDPSATQCMSTGVCVLQAGNLYFARAGFVPDTAWTPRAAYGLGPADFSWLSGPGGSVALDFSPSGAPLQFGFYRAKSGGPGPETGLDDWRVALQPPCTGDPDCDDADGCTTEVCDLGICERETVSCDDGDACTTDTCAGGTCQSAPIVCDDGDACTTDACAFGGCQFTPTVDLDTAIAKLDEFLAEIAGSPCGGVALVAQVARKLTKKAKKARRFLVRADATTKAAAIERFLGRVDVLLPRVQGFIADAVVDGVVPADCGAFLDAFIVDALACKG